MAEFIKIKRKEPTERFYSHVDIEFSVRVYNILGFAESLGTLDILHRTGVEEKVYYPGVHINDVRSHQFYTGKGKGPSVLLGLTRINSKEDCRQFIDETRILNWRKAMGDRFPESPLFESEEIWRVLCHEFAINIYEHAGRPGFIAMRVVKPFDEETGKIRKWLRFSYPDYIIKLSRSMRSGFLELCIEDAGRGLIGTLEKALSKHIDRDAIKLEDVLAFAFDELGTCKNPDESWATERHALNRILHIVAKYGGALIVRSGGMELVYLSKGEMFKKKRNCWGYEPSDGHGMEGVIPGSQFQIILPLEPTISRKIHQTKSVLETPLPSSYYTEVDQVRGHLLPLLERLDQKKACVGNKEQRRFREACEKISKELILKRSQSDPLVLDFSQLHWSAGQFETLLHYLQNIIQNRPVLLVEIAPDLALDVVQLEELSAPTKLDKKLVYSKPSKAGRFYGELSERRYLETYCGIHNTVMGIDRNGRRYIFGLRNPAYKAALLSLIETKKTIKELCDETFWGETLKENILNSILNNINPMFRVDDEGRWSTVWGIRELSNEVKRVMSYHFDDVAKRSKAWRGAPFKGEKSKFKIPWEKEWRANFLEGSRILSRERHADEVAQRLIYRLEKGLTIIGKSIEDVRVLACVTAPAMLLASFLHRWWPSALEKPAVSDLGHYVMLSHPKDLPSIIKAGGIVVVQDVIDISKISDDLVNVLKSQSLDILCILGFIQMVPKLRKATITPIDKGWLPTVDEDEETFIPKHAMIEVARPPKCEPPQTVEEESNAFWIEPRTMRPFRYTTLRRQFEPGRDPYLDRRNKYLVRFDKSSKGCLFAAGHYVYGSRHFAIAVDVQKALRGEIGDEIALWLADICENPKGREKADWESQEGRSLEGDASAVLMPLHSQIHYLWPKIENILAQRGRRQPAWLLDATLFSGRGPAYRIPKQFQHQIKMAVEEAVKLKGSKSEYISKPLRILILDETVATARTAETILLKILQTVNKEFRALKVGMDQCPNPIQWIRFFCVLNQLGQARHILWKNFRAIGNTSIKFVLEEYAPFMGIPVYTEDDCPTCRDCNRLKHLMSICEQYGIEAARNWVEVRLEELQTIAIDSPGFNNPGAVYLKRGIDVLIRKGNDSGRSAFPPMHASTAIWRFYELMYFSYPPGDVLQALTNAWGTEEDGPEEVKEYEGYRWAVFEWCLRNWKRVEANAATEIFISQAKQEAKQNTSLIQPILEACAQHFEDPKIIKFIAECIDILADLESQRLPGDREVDPERNQRTVNLFTALALFWLNVPEKKRDSLVYIDADIDEEIRLIDHLDKTASKLDPRGHNFLRNLYRQLNRPQRHIDPKWALDTIAESLFRGRDPIFSRDGRHHLLPKLISDILSRGADEEDRHLLHGSLTLFLAALDDILHYDYQLFTYTTEIKNLSEKILDWMAHPFVSKNGSKIPRRDLRNLLDALSLEGKLCKEFNDTLHEEIESFRKYLEDRAEELGTGRFEFEYAPSEDAKYCRVLMHGQRLRICLANLTIDRIKDVETCHKSRIEVFRIQDERKKERLCFRLLTNFAPLDETRTLTSQGPNVKTDKYRLELFGAEFDETWETPSFDEQKMGFTSSYEIRVPSGFLTRRK